MDIATLWIGWALVAVLGTTLVACVYGKSAAPDNHGTAALVIGGGFLVGQFLLTLWMRLIAALGIPFGIASIGGPLLAATALAGWLAARRIRLPLSRFVGHARVALLGGTLTRGERVMCLALLGWLALRFALLLIEVMRRPLYPWDAWTQWATKARVWFELKRMAPFVTPSEWLAAPAGTVYVDAAPHYPATVPLAQVWSATLLGRWDDALVNVTWWITALAFALALYGCLRRMRFGPLASLVGVWLLVSLPILDAHIALAGYADLAMAAYLTLAALVWLRFAQTHERPDLALALVLSAACVLIKNPGKLWLAMLVPGIVTAWMPRQGRRIAAACFGVAVVAALFLTRASLTILGYRLQLDYDMPWRGLIDAYFAFANWHLLFYGALAAAVIGWRRLLATDVAPLTIIVAFGVAFLLFGFAFTNARAWVEDQSTVNRATLHLAPLIVVWMMVTFRAWSQSATHSPADTEVARAAKA